MPGEAKPRFLYIFLDEAGNLDFSRTGTRYFVLGGITKERPFHAYKELTELKYDLVERGMALEYFHAAEDNQATRNQVFDIIEKHLAGVAVDAIIVEKAKVPPALHPDEHFYPRVLGTLLREILRQYRLAEFAEVIVFTDSLPMTRKRAAVEKGVKHDAARHAAADGALSSTAPRLEVEPGLADRRLLHLGHLPEVERTGRTLVPAGAGGCAQRVGCAPSGNGLA